MSNSTSQEQAFRTSLSAVDINTAGTDAKKLLTKAQSAYGMIPNMFSAMANYPALLETYMNGYAQLYASGGFTPVEQEVLFLTISRENGCEYCVAAHSFAGDFVSNVPKETTDAIRESKEIPDPKLKALNEFALVMMRKKGNPTSADVEKFKAAGFSENHILPIILSISIKTLSNFTNHMFHTPLEPMMASRTWKL